MSGHDAMKDIRCPFFMNFWEEGIKLLTTENCSECNGAYNNSNPSKRVRFDDRRPSVGDHREFSNQRVSVMIGWGGQGKCS
jgi:hypothetical protein